MSYTRSSTVKEGRAKAELLFGSLLAELAEMLLKVKADNQAGVLPKKKVGPIVCGSIPFNSRHLYRQSRAGFILTHVIYVINLKARMAQNE